ncbi:Phage Tail Collar Domain [Shimia gijangensis]|uniref:Phage Tail Collar Domain n=1 Tax=Shimia gijangensis TaxID=1470563 RepID=A0A1M6CTK4_9RHOB|nr:tail fiber protein [Shimia gijangensis]SHI64223.1 Phage Tail Collar Domain [Shimia gijangensis]
MLKRVFGAVLCAASLQVSAAPVKAGMDPYLGEVMMFAGTFCPRGYLSADGQILSINQYQALFSLLGATYGGDGRTTFALPDLRGRVPVGVGDAEAVTIHEGTTGGAVENLFQRGDSPAFIGMRYCIAIEGLYPSRN